MKGFLQQKGQTAVEYILMVAIAVMVAVACFKAIEAYLISNQNSMLAKQLNSYKRFLGRDPEFKRFRIPGG
jgi:Flp pilus assembly pilin Flp